MTLEKSFCPEQEPYVDVGLAADYIRSVQKDSGEIPWSKGGQTDNWDHVENAMALTVCGYEKEARNAYTWSANVQMDDGSWWSYYDNGKPRKDSHKDPNMSAYITVGLFHYYAATKDKVFLYYMWNTVSRAMDFILEMQGDEGQVYWNKSKTGIIEKKALLTGSCSIYLSISCALAIASVLGIKKPEWKIAREKLKNAITNKPHLFDKTKSRYSMDWYYPVLSGVYQGEKAKKRIESMWDLFVIRDWGVRCVSDRPWVTIGESSELCISLCACGNRSLAETVFEWIYEKKYDDGAYWTGITVPDKIIYTEEKTTWSGAGVILAADSIYSLSSADRFFHHGFIDAYIDQPLLRVS